jgi:DNA-binding transcriptional LysR family regulator
MDIKQLKNFLILTETLNYRKTSEEIFLAQPALSRQIKQLETEIGAILFKRNKRSVELTPAGKHFSQEVKRMIRQLEKAVQHTARIHRGEAGEIHIGHASSSMQSVLPDILVRFRQQMPELKTHLLESTNSFEIEALLNREIDIGFAPNILVPDAIATKVIYEENFVVILPHNHPLNAEEFTDLSILSKENFILPPYEQGRGYLEVIDEMCQKYGFTPNVVHESGNSATVLRLVEAGIGISIEPKSTLNGTLLRIKSIELVHIPQKSKMLVIWLKERTDELKPFLNLIFNEDI